MTRKFNLSADSFEPEFFQKFEFVLVVSMFHRKNIDVFPYPICSRGRFPIHVSPYAVSLSNRADNAILLEPFSTHPWRRVRYDFY